MENDEKIILHISVERKHAIYDKNDGSIVCANGNYVVEFAFDKEWNAYEKKKARFTVWHGGIHKHIDVEFSGNTCPVPPLANVKYVKVGVYIEGGISTTSPAVIDCDLSILCGSSRSVLPDSFIATMNEALKGKDGKDGLSAYEVAVKNGFGGTEVEWLSSLQGENGKDGIDGSNGLDGKDGVDGKTPYIQDGYWYINGVNTNVKAEGVDGKDGKDGADATNDVAIPPYWETMVAEKTATVKALQTAGGRNCVSFAWASDTHIPDNDGGTTTDIGKVMAKMLDNCEIPFAVLSGDIATRASYSTEALYLEKQKQMPQHLAPLWATDRLLMALGNHDGCWGDPDGYYRHQFSPERMWQTYFRGQALDFRRVFSEDGLYFYVDNTVQKTRFILLNSNFGGEYAEDANGWALNDRFNNFCYGQAQLDWLANIALDMPEGYGAIIVSHVPPNMTSNKHLDKAQLIGIINAYCNKTTFEGSYTEGVDGWSNSTISVDFTDAKGEILAMFAGHVHGDSIDTQTLACPLLTILSAGATPNDPYKEDAPTRTAGTDTETCFDVVTINRATKTINCTRVGAGADRTVYYGEQPAYTNLLPLAENADGTDYVGSHEKGGDGYEYGYRIRGVGTLQAFTDYDLYATGFMPVTNDNHKIYVKNIELASDNNKVAFYDESHATAVVDNFRDTGTAITLNNGVWEISVDYYETKAQEGQLIKYFKIGCGSISDDTIITVDEPIE